MVAMKVAISHWQNRIAPVFDVAERLLLIEVEGELETGREHLRFTGISLFDRTKVLLRLGVETLVCGAVSKALETDLRASGIRVVAFICGEVESVVAALKTNRLSQPCFHMPGSSLQRRNARPDGNKRVMLQQGDSRKENGDKGNDRSKTV